MTTMKKHSKRMKQNTRAPQRKKKKKGNEKREIYEWNLLKFYFWLSYKISFSLIPLYPSISFRFVHFVCVNAVCSLHSFFFFSFFPILVTFISPHNFLMLIIISVYHCSYNENCFPRKWMVRVDVAVFQVKLNWLNRLWIS